MFGTVDYFVAVFCEIGEAMLFDRIKFYRKRIEELESELLLMIWR